MASVEYDHEIPYGYDESGRPFPKLTLRLSNPTNAEQAIDSDGYLDSGAERSLFAGSLAPIIGIQDLLNGPALSFQSAGGALIEARLHVVRLSHPLIGDFTLEAGFTVGPISRNLLGRDFFDQIQIGFRERHLVIYITAHP